MLVERHQKPLYVLCYRMLGDSEAAADAVQESFLAAYRSLRRYQGGTPGGWLARIAINKCYDELRARQKRPQTSLDSFDRDGRELPRLHADGHETPEQRALRNELAGEIQRGLQDLPAVQRLTVTLSDIQGYSYEEIAEITGWPIGTVKSRLARGRMRLRDALRDR
jgi:RNA polymerase sigma-70 factor (ECF subfamily)